MYIPISSCLLVDGGKIVDYTAEEGYYTVNNSSEPSLFNGDLGDSVKESFNRVRFGGTTPYAQKVFYVNLQEIKGIKFGTTNPVNYFDSFYNSELFLRASPTSMSSICRNSWVRSRQPSTRCRQTACGSPM